jgi:hypothetical protein
MKFRVSRCFAVRCAAWYFFLIFDFLFFVIFFFSLLKMLHSTLYLLYFHVFFFFFLGEGATAFGYELELFRGTPEYFAGLEQV